MSGGGNKTNNNQGALSPTSPGMPPKTREVFQGVRNTVFRNPQGQPGTPGRTPDFWQNFREGYVRDALEQRQNTPPRNPGTPERTFGTPGTNPQSSPPKRPGGK